MPPRRRFKRRRSFKSRSGPSVRRYRAKRRVTYRRRRVIQRRRGIPRSINIRNSAGLFPDKLRTKLTFSYRATYPLAAKGFATIIRGNTPYDPLYEIGGGTASMLRLYSSLYSSMLVHGSSCRVNVVSTGSASVDPGNTIPRIHHVYLYPTRGSTPYSLANIDYNKRAIPLSKYASTGGNVPSRPARVKNYMSNRRLYGLNAVTTQQQYGNFMSETTGTPNRQWNWIIEVERDGESISSVPPNGVMDISVTYYVEFYNRIMDPSIWDGST